MCVLLGILKRHGQSDKSGGALHLHVGRGGRMPLPTCEGGAPPDYIISAASFVACKIH